MKISPIEETEHTLNVLVYGDPGVGKTTFAASAAKHPELGPVLFINIEGGMLSIRSEDKVYTTEQIKSTADVEALFWRLQKGELEQFKTIVLDSITELQTLNLEEIGKKGGRGVDALELQDYGKSTAQLRRLFRMFRDLPRHVIFTALVVREMPQTNRKSAQPTEVRPHLTSKLSQSVQGYMDAVWYLYVDADGERQLLTSPVGPYKAKTRGARFAERIGNKIQNPNLSDLYTHLTETE